jgi:hypothetical protein
MQPRAQDPLGPAGPGPVHVQAHVALQAREVLGHLAEAVGGHAQGQTKACKGSLPAPRYTGKPTIRAMPTGPASTDVPPAATATIDTIPETGK